MISKEIMKLIKIETSLRAIKKLLGVDYYRNNHMLTKEMFISAAGLSRGGIKMARVKTGEQYYIITNLINISEAYEDNDEFDDDHFERGNYFNTKEEALEALGEIRKIIEKYR